MPCVRAQILNENSSPLLANSLAARGLNGTAGLSPDDFQESNMKHSMNGLLFCNARDFNVTLGQKCGSRLLLCSTAAHGRSSFTCLGRWERALAQHGSLGRADGVL
jgi:hypothetical protein